MCVWPIKIRCCFVILRERELQKKKNKAPKNKGTTTTKKNIFTHTIYRIYLILYIAGIRPRGISIAHRILF